jgi:hypothetical protein
MQSTQSGSLPLLWEFWQFSFQSHHISVFIRAYNSLNVGYVATPSTRLFGGIQTDDGDDDDDDDDDDNEEVIQSMRLKV